MHGLRGPSLCTGSAPSGSSTPAPLGGASASVSRLLGEPGEEGLPANLLPKQAQSPAQPWALQAAWLRGQRRERTPGLRASVLGRGLVPRQAPPGGEQKAGRLCWAVVWAGWAVPAEIWLMEGFPEERASWTTKPSSAGGALAAPQCGQAPSPLSPRQPLTPEGRAGPCAGGGGGETSRLSTVPSVIPSCWGARLPLHVSHAPPLHGRAEEAPG